MIRRFFLILAMLVAFLGNARPAYASAFPIPVYVDTSYTGSEDGTINHPYNTVQEGRSFLQSQAGGGWLYVKKADGTWSDPERVWPIVSGATGTPLTDTALYIILTILALGLLLAGWKFQHRGRQLHKA